MKKIYINYLQNREFGQKAAQIFYPSRAAVFLDTVRARDEKDGAKPTPPKTDSTGSLCILLFFLLAFSAANLTADERPILNINEYSLIGDIDFSPYAGGENLLLATRACERTEDYFFRNHQFADPKSAKARIARLSEMVTVWLPLNYEAMLIQHEVFGHGYRIRDVGSNRAHVSGYRLGLPPPYGGGGGSTSYSFSDKLTASEESAISSAGVEASSILANLTKLKWLATRKIDPRQSVLYLLTQQDLSLYISSIKVVRSNPNIDFSGHDIDAYLKTVNLTYTGSHLSSGRLRSLSWINLLDPFTFYSLWSWFHYVGSGRDTKIPMISIRKVGYLFGARLGLTPFGPEIFWDNYFSTGGKVFYGYLKVGNHAGNTYLGAGVYLPILWTIKQWEFGARLDLWRQPKLLLSQGSIAFNDIDEENYPTPENPLYSYSEQHAMRLGAAGSVTVAYHWNKTFGFEGEFGAKSRGFLPGNSLWAAPIVRGGFSARF